MSTFSKLFGAAARASEARAEAEDRTAKRRLEAMSDNQLIMAALYDIGAGMGCEDDVLLDELQRRAHLKHNP